MRVDFALRERESLASKMVETDHWLAAAYAGRWQEVIAGWAGVFAPQRNAFAV